MTKTAGLILNIVNETNEHLTAEQIYFRIKELRPKTVLATVYNNLASLCEQGMIRKVCIDGCPDRYDNALRRHDHLICSCCKRISDIVLEDYTTKLKHATGINVNSYELRVYYICHECMKKKAKEDS